MLNRLLQVLVGVTSFVLILPSIILTPIFYILFKLPLCMVLLVLFSNSLDDDWDYKTFLNYIK